MAVRKHEIPLSPASSTLPSNANLDVAKSELGLNFFTASTLNINLDSTNGLRASSAGAGGMLRPTSAAPNFSKKEEMALKEQLARSAGAILIQCVFRGWVIRRKYVAVVYYHLTKQSVTSGESKIYTGLPDVSDFTVQERLLRKFKIYCKLYEKQAKVLPEFSFFCAAVIQSIFRMFVVRRSWLRIKSMTHEDRNGSAGHEARQEIKRMTERTDFKAGTWIDAAKKIQRAWRSYYAIKIYRFYRELIRFREKGDPKKLLKFVNPKEAQLIDGASGIHVRFRLGGTKFPPTIYYKIFVHSRMVDMNAFSPRDYTKEAKQLQPKVLFTNVQPLPSGNPENGGWYKRYENNGWRPVSDRVWDERNDEITQATSELPVTYHFSKLRRRQELERKRKQKKLKWLRAMYEEGRRVADAKQGYEYDEDEEEEFDTEEDLLQAINDLEKDLDHELMSKWSDALDFEAYIQNWMTISLTGKSDDPRTFEIDIDGESEYGQGMSKKLRHVHGVSAYDGEETGDDLMAEIDLFRKITDEAQADAGSRADAESRLEGSVAGVGVAGGGEKGAVQKKKERPWSGRSAQSVQNPFLSAGLDDF
ncbi:hypothetical protein HDU97_001617 [Phlyctochytrium planicorne]|nr:hypothetical protein HDU97_001617 [Phlyctochytrium planicorne]